MKRTKLLQELRQMQFVSIYEDWHLKRLTQQDAALMLGVTDRTFRRYVERYEQDGLDGLLDRRLERLSNRCAPADEVCRLEDMYRSRFNGWNVQHFYRFYERDGGTRCYTWVKKRLQAAGLVKKAKSKGKHRKRRERACAAGMMIHQDGSTHHWIPQEKWDLIVTMDDATGEHYSMFFVDEEGTDSSFQGIIDIIESKGLPCSFYSDRGSHYWHTPVAGGKVDKSNPTQFGRAMGQLGIQMIASYSPEARGRSERAFKTHQGRLPNELALHGITTKQEANRYLRETYMPRHNQEFMVKPQSDIAVFVPHQGADIAEILCEHHERTVTKDNCISFEGQTLQIPKQDHRWGYAKAKVIVHRYLDGSLSIFHGPRCLGRYDQRGNLQTNKAAA